MAQLTGGPVIGEGHRQLQRAGDFNPTPPKRCRTPGCNSQGEWPGQPCPRCRTSERPDGAASDRALRVAPVPTSGRSVAQGADAGPDTSVHAEPVRSLDELAAAVNHAHTQVERSGRQMIEYAIRAGEALLEARRRVKKGMWLYWCEHHVGAHITTIHRYMRLAEHKKQVRGSDAQTIEAAMRVLADRPRRGQGARALSHSDRVALVELYHEEGLAAVQKAYGVSKSTVWRYVSERSPHRLVRQDTPPQVTEDRVARLAWCLVNRFGGDTYPVRVTPEVMADARDILTRVFTEPIGDKEAA